MYYTYHIVIDQHTDRKIAIENVFHTVPKNLILFENLHKLHKIELPKSSKSILACHINSEVIGLVANILARKT